MDRPGHRFSLRRQIVWSTRVFTVLTSLAVCAALFFLSNQYVRTNTLQAAEFNLRLVATSIETSLNDADALLNWASINDTVRRYLSQEEVNGPQTIAAYKAAQEKYYSNPLYPKVIRFFMSNENDRHLQFGPLNSSSALNQSSVSLFLQQGYGMRFTTDPLMISHPACLAISRPIRSGHGTMHRGTAYLALDPSVITDPAAGYTTSEGSALYWEMGNQLWQIEDGRLTQVETAFSDVSYTLRSTVENRTWKQSAWQGRFRKGDSSYFAIKVVLEGRGAALIQVMPESTFLQQRRVYLWLLGLGLAIVWGLSFLMQHWLEWAITRPVEALQKRIEAVGGGDFTADPAVEWPNELGDIGRGINKLAADVDGLMARRVEDERKKQELEYRMLQNEVNPHFIYNTLNSIRWMATIQQYRYGGDLEIEVSRIEDERLCRDCMIPRFTLQPLVENAIFHGLEPKGGHGSVLLDISTDPATGDVLLRLTDDGIGMPPEQVAHLLDAPAGEKEKAEKFRHVGLRNVNRRIQYSFGEAYGLTIESEEGIGTEVTIRLPYQRKGNDHAADLTCG